MSDLSTSQREALRDSDVAYIDRSGERHLPINDPDHVRNASARFGQTDFQSKTARNSAAKRILAAAKRHDIEVDERSDVMRAARSDPSRGPRSPQTGIARAAARVTSVRM